MSLRPLRDFIVVETLPAAARTASAILLPDVARERPQQGRVIAAGPGRRATSGRLAPQVGAGDRVIYGAMAGIAMKIDGKDCLVLREDEILGTVDGAGEVVVRDRLGAGANTATPCTLDHVHGLDCCDD